MDIEGVVADNYMNRTTVINNRHSDIKKEEHAHAAKDASISEIDAEI